MNLEQQLSANRLAFDRDILIKQDIAEKTRINPNYRRLRYVGEAKPYNQILQWSSELDKYPLLANEREFIIEQFCIFASNSPENIKKLLALNVMRHAAKSIHATSRPPIVVKALNLTGYLLS
jgi:hypothetical protein